MPSLPAKIKVWLILSKTLEKQKLNFCRSALFLMKARVSLKYFLNDCRFNGVYPRDNLPNKRKDGVYPTNLDE